MTVMTSKNENVLTMALCISSESLDPGNTARHPVFDFLATFNDLKIENVLTIVCISNES